MQKTSLETYKKIKENGLLSRARLRVYDYIVSHQPISINSLIAALGKEGSNSSTVSGRVSELVNLGVVEKCGYEVAPTGNRVNLWCTTDHLPAKLVKMETKKQQIERLYARIDDLEKRLKYQSCGLPTGCGDIMHLSFRNLP